MKIRWILLLLVALTSLGSADLSAQTPDLQPMLVEELSGTLRVQQGVPCAADVDLTTPITAGRLQLTPVSGSDVPGGKQFTLSRADVRFASFSVHRDCLGIGETRNYSEVGVELGKVVTLVATPSAPNTYTVSIPKENFVIHQLVVVNDESEDGYVQPSQDVTGTIDLAHGTVNFLVVVDTRVHFEAGCPLCIINEDRDGRLTATVAGTIVFPDSDADGVADRVDNCRFVPNPDQTPVPTPSILAPADLTLASCLDHRLGAAKAADLCDATPVTVTNNAPAIFARGANLVTWSAQDGLARTASDTQTVTIVDTTAPTFTFVPPDVAASNCGAVNLGTAAATDDCAGTPTVTNNAPAYFYAGPTIVTWAARDLSGNSTVASQTVNVADSVAPTVSCVAERPLGNSFRVAATDACAGTPVIRLGRFVLTEGEQIKINETGQPGVRLVNVASGIRHFQVGRGEAVISATDASGNVATAICR